MGLQFVGKVLGGVGCVGEDLGEPVVFGVGAVEFCERCS